LSHQQALCPFVKDVFCEEAQRVKDDRLRPIEERFNSLSTVKDEDVFKPWQDAKKRTKEMLWSREQNMHVVGKTHKSTMDVMKADIMRSYQLL
jgi:hypothetical protein